MGSKTIAIQVCFHCTPHYNQATRDKDHSFQSNTTLVSIQLDICGFLTGNSSTALWNKEV